MMQARSPITLDPLLTLLGGPKSNTPSGAPAQVPADILLFGDILGLLGNFGAGQTSPLTPSTSGVGQASDATASNEADLFSALDSGNMTPLTAGTLAALLNAPTAALNSAAAPTDQAVESSLPQFEVPPVDGNQPSDLLDAFISEAMAQAKTLGPAEPLFMTGAMPTTWNQLPSESIPEGSFKVISSQVIGDQLQLELQSRENPGTQFKLTVPTASLTLTAAESDTTRKTGLPTSSLRSNRVAIRPGSTSAIDDLFGRLSVTELTLTNELPTEAITQPNAAVRLELAADQSSRATRITLVAPRSSLRLVSSDPLIAEQPALPTEQSPSTASSSGATAGQKVVSAGTATPAAATLAPEESSSFTVRPVATKWDTEQFADETSSAIKSLQSGIDRSEALSRPVDARSVKVPVKITLPDLPKMLSGGTRTLTIKLEPEHLGPARLHLSVVNDTITARLSVETPTAKAAVERGLDQLTDQLSRAGLKVNYIEVSLRGGSYQESAYHQTNWFRSQRSQLRRASDDALTPAAPLAAITTRRPSSYLGSSGVNLYA